MTGVSHSLCSWSPVYCLSVTKMFLQRCEEEGECSALSTWLTRLWIISLGYLVKLWLQTNLRWRTNHTAVCSLVSVAKRCTGHLGFLAPSKELMNWEFYHGSPMGYLTLKLFRCLVGRSFGQSEPSTSVWQPVSTTSPQMSHGSRWTTGGCTLKGDAYGKRSSKIQTVDSAFENKNYRFLGHRNEADGSDVECSPRNKRRLN